LIYIYAKGLLFPGFRRLCRRKPGNSFIHGAGEARDTSALARVCRQYPATSPMYDRLRIAAEPSDDLHRAPPGLIALENTHNRCGGRVLHLEYLAAVHAIADEYDLPLHLDGARVFNAAVALDVDVRRITRHVHTLQFCLSKGLAAPVGSIVAGPQTFVDNVRRVRKMLGGGMRQAGIIAAAGIVALEQMIERLAEDHRHARLLAEGLATIPGLRIDPELVETDIVRFELLTEHPTVPEFMATLAQRGILIGDLGGRFLRAVTHYGITAADVQQTVAVVRDVLA
jgi:threonine aldolase